MKAENCASKVLSARLKRLYSQDIESKGQFC